MASGIPAWGMPMMDGANNNSGTVILSLFITSTFRPSIRKLFPFLPFHLIKKYIPARLLSVDFAAIFPELFTIKHCLFTEMWEKLPEHIQDLHVYLVVPSASQYL